MVVPIQVQINTSGALKKLSNVEQFVRIDIPRLTFEQADRGAEHAASIAPMDTGALIQAIGVTQSERGRNSQGWAVVSRTPPNKYSNKYGRHTNPKKRPYHAYLEYGKVVNVRGGRTQRYMEATADWLSREYPELIKKRLMNKIK